MTFIRSNQFLRGIARIQVAGVVRFRDRVYQLARRGPADGAVEADGETLTLLHKTMKKVANRSLGQGGAPSTSESVYDWLL